MKNAGSNKPNKMKIQQIKQKLYYIVANYIALLKGKTKNRA